MENKSSYELFEFINHNIVYSQGNINQTFLITELISSKLIKAYRFLTIF